MDGLMQNHLNKTIIIINDRKPGVASTVTEKRNNHRKTPEQLQKLHFFIETRDRKERPDPSATPRSSSLLQQTFITEMTLEMIFLDNCCRTLKPMDYFNVACILQE